MTFMLDFFLIFCCICKFESNEHVHILFRILIRNKNENQTTAKKQLKPQIKAILNLISSHFFFKNIYVCINNSTNFTRFTV